jgi:DNA polymerase-3 subunit delta'
MRASRPDAIRAQLLRAAASGQVHGAYLFEGPPGAGKRELALFFARLLLCKRPGPEGACGACHDCRLLAASGGEGERPTHPDLHWVDADGPRIKIDAVRELKAALALTANEGGRRVGLIPEAEKLRAEAANALLKTLEEPPPDTVLILIATTSEGLPRTLRSRTLRLRLAPWSESAVRERLVGEGLAEADAALASALGGASPESARAWAERSLDEAREMRELLAGIARLGATELLDFAETFRKPGEAGRDRARLFIDVEATHARAEAAAAAQTGDARALALWIGAFEAAARARRELDARNLNPQLVVEGLLLELRGNV